MPGRDESRLPVKMVSDGDEPPLPECRPATLRRYTAPTQQLVSDENESFGACFGARRALDKDNGLVDSSCCLTKPPVGLSTAGDTLCEIAFGVGLGEQQKPLTHKHSKILDLT